MKKAILSLLILATTSLMAQEVLTLEDAILKSRKELAPERLEALQWIEGTSSYSYVKDDALMRGGMGREADRELISLAALNKALPEGTVLDDFPSIHWLSGNGFDFKQGDTNYAYDLKTNKVTTLYRTLPDAENFDHTNDRKKVAYTVGQNLYIAQEGSKGQIAITTDSLDGIVNGQAVHRFEFGIRKGTFWSPQGNLLAFYRKDETMVTKYQLEDINTMPSTFNSTRYPMIGQASHHARLGIFDLRTQRTIYLNVEGPAELYLTNIAWAPEEQHIYVVIVDRSQDHLKVVEFDVKTANATRTLFEERDEQYVEPELAMEFVKGSKDLYLWKSERDGWDHLYLYSLKKGLQRQLTSGQWEVNELLGMDPNGATLVIEGTGKNPTENHLYRVDMASGRTVQLTKDAGSHHGTLSGDGALLIDQWSSITVPGRTDIINTADGTLMKTIVDAADPLAKKTVGKVELLTVPGADGKPLHARLIKPSSFQSREKYPVLVYVYNGPHVQLVTNSWLGGAPMWMLHAAERGYLIFTVDGRGSKERGLDFEQAIFRQMGELEMDDQIAGVEYLKTLPYVDQEKLAVHGWSYGGYMTTSLMTKRAGVFDVGVAGGPVMDWRMYEVMYGERYMDTPEENPDGFEKTSLLNKADLLKGDLLIIHGQVDDVVVPEHSYKFLKACVDAGTQVDFFLYPGHPHNVRGKDRVHLMEKVLGYIDEKLGM